MKKFLLILSLGASTAFGQTFPVNNLQVNGTANFAGTATLNGSAVVNGAANFNNTAAFAVGPTAPTAALGTNTTQLATTAFDAAGKPCPSVMDHGGDNTGATNNDTALTNTVAASTANNICVYFPPGIYKFASQFVYTLPNTFASFTIKGAGATVTQLQWGAATGGIKINYQGGRNSSHISDLSFVTTFAGTSTALTLNQTAAFSAGGNLPTDITNVSFYGSDFPAPSSNYWTTGIDDFGVSDVNVINVGMSAIGSGAGIGMNFRGNATTFAVQINVIGCYIYQYGVGINYGNYTQGLTVSQTNIVGGGVSGIGIYAAPGLTNLSQLTVIGSEFQVNGTQISINSPLNGLLISGNMIEINNNQIGIFAAFAGQFSIVGNEFVGWNGATGNDGILIQSSNSPDAGVITGNIFNNLSAGIVLQASSSHVNVQSNAYSAVATTVNNGGTGNTVAGGSQ